MPNDGTFGFNRPDANALLDLIATHDVEHEEIKPIGGAGAGLIVQTPGGGIAARSGTTVSSASCTKFTISSGSLSTLTDTVTVHNIWPFAIPASHFIMALQSGGGMIALLPGIVDLRLSGNDLQYTYDGTNWSTWHTASTCP